MSRVLGDGAVTLLVKGFVSVLFAITLLNLIVELQGNGEITALSGALLFVYASGVLAVGVFTDRLFAPRVQIALFSGLTAYWVYDYFSRNNTLSILLIVFGVAVLVQQARRLTR
jgi:prolipoprotein diacylglyceryltransferase